MYGDGYQWEILPEDNGGGSGGGYTPLPYPTPATNGGGRPPLPTDEGPPPRPPIDFVIPDDVVDAAPTVPLEDKIAAAGFGGGLGMLVAGAALLFVLTRRR